MSRHGVNIETSDAIGAGCVFSMVAIVVAACIGYVLNILKIFGALGDPITGFFVGRVIGAFIVPIGCIVGWL